jgi:lipopolysaccharide export system ATP-binding protein
MSFLRASGLVKSYRSRTVVRGIDLEVRQGEVVGLLGPNGAGKTTTFYMIVGLTRPDRGVVLLDDEEITTLPMYLRARKGINYLPQEPSVFRKLTVEENILAVLENLPYKKAERLEVMEGLLRDLSISHLARRKAHSLSGGERRRVEICRALATAPRFILLDEPFAGIDPIAVLEIQKIAAILKQRGIGILITDHNVQETLEITDRAYIICAGEILEEGTPAQIARSERARQIYLGERFQLSAPAGPGGA